MPILRGNVLLLSSGSLILIHMNAEVCWEKRNVSVIRESFRKSGHSGLWERERSALNVLIGQISSNVPT